MKEPSREKEKKVGGYQLILFSSQFRSLSLSLQAARLSIRYFGFNAQNYCSFFSTALQRPFHGIVSHYAGVEFERKRIKNSLPANYDILSLELVIY